MTEYTYTLITFYSLELVVYIINIKYFECI